MFSHKKSLGQIFTYGVICAITIIFTLLDVTVFLSESARQYPLIRNLRINEAFAAAPAYRSSGTFSAGTSIISPPYPADMMAGDLCLLAVESENQAITLMIPNGFVEVSPWSPQFAGIPATNPASRLAVFWKRTVGGDTAPIVADSGNHTTAQIHCFSGVVDSGNPWDTGSGGNDSGANDTTGVIPGSSTSVADTLVVLIISSSRNGNSTANCSGWTNTDLASLTERTDNTSTVGLGGGHCLATAIKAAPGVYRDTTVSMSVKTFKGAMSLALRSQNFAAIGNVVSSTFDTATSNGAAFNSLLWKGIKPPSTKVRLQFATSNSASGPFDFIGGSLCSTFDYYESNPDSPSAIGCFPSHTNKRYFRYKIILCSWSDCVTPGSETPRVDDIIINWSP